MGYEALMKALRRKEDAATIIQMIKSWYVCQIFKSMKLLSMNGCQERCFKFEKKKLKGVHMLMPYAQGWCKHVPTMAPRCLVVVE